MLFLGSGGDQVVSVVAFYSVDPSSNPAEVYSFNSVNSLKRTKIHKKRPGLDHLFNKNIFSVNVTLIAWNGAFRKWDSQDMCQSLFSTNFLWSEGCRQSSVDLSAHSILPPGFKSQAHQLYFINFYLKCAGRPGGFRATR